MAQLDWELTAAQLASDGFSILRGLPGSARARAWASALSSSDRALRYLDDAELPRPLDTWRRRLYARLVPIANRWNEAMGRAHRFPSEWSDLLARNGFAGQRPTHSFVHRLGTSEYRALHRAADGEHVFPFQLMILLSDPDRDFSGGELILTERRHRMQTRPLVVPLGLGDSVLITTAQRPVKGSHGYYSTHFKHGVSRVHRGLRLALELSFHDAPAEVGELP